MADKPTKEKIPNPRHAAAEAIAEQFKKRREQGETAEYADDNAEWLDENMPPEEQGAGEGEERPRDAQGRFVRREEAPDTEEVPPGREDVVATGLIEQEPLDPPEPAPAASDEPETVQIKVDGETFDVPKADVDNAGGERAYRLNLAAEARFNRAKEYEKQALAKLHSPAPEQSYEPDDQPSAIPAEELTQLADDLRYGEPEEVQRAITKLASLSPSTPVGPDVRETIEDELARQTALDNFKRNYGALWNDPDYRRLVIAKDDELRDPNSPEYIASYAERYEHIGETLSEKLHVSGTPGDTPTPDTLTSRQQRKERLNSPTTTGGSVPNPGQVTTPRTPTERERHRKGLDQLRRGRQQA